MIRTIAAMRSNQAARLKNSHQMTKAGKPARPPMTANMVASGATTGRPNLASHCTVTMATPGHNRNDLDEEAGFGISLLMAFTAEISEAANVIENRVVPTNEEGHKRHLCLLRPW